MDLLCPIYDPPDGAAEQALEVYQPDFADGFLAGVASELSFPVAGLNTWGFPTALDTAVPDELNGRWSLTPPASNASYVSTQELISSTTYFTEPSLHDLDVRSPSFAPHAVFASQPDLDFADVHLPTSVAQAYGLSDCIDGHDRSNVAVSIIPRNESRPRPYPYVPSALLASTPEPPMHAPLRRSRQSSDARFPLLERSLRWFGTGSGRSNIRKHPRSAQRTRSGPGVAGKAAGELTRAASSNGVSITEIRRHCCDRSDGNGGLCGKRFRQREHLKRHARVHDDLSVRKKFCCPVAHFFGEWMCPRGRRRPITDRPDNMAQHCSTHCFGNSVNGSRNAVFHKEVLAAVYAQQLREESADDKVIKARQASVKICLYGRVENLNKEKLGENWTPKVNAHIDHSLMQKLFPRGFVSCEGFDTFPSSLASSGETWHHCIDKKVAWCHAIIKPGPKPGEEPMTLGLKDFAPGQARVRR